MPRQIFVVVFLDIFYFLLFLCGFTCHWQFSGEETHSPTPTIEMFGSSINNNKLGISFNVFLDFRDSSVFDKFLNRKNVLFIFSYCRETYMVRTLKQLKVMKICLIMKMRSTRLLWNPSRIVNRHRRSYTNTI